MNESAPNYARPQAMFKSLRRLHGHNLEHQGEKVGRSAPDHMIGSPPSVARKLSVGRLRRTWSHSAVEFMKYRRLLPMLVADEHDAGSAFDDFNMHDPRSSLTSRPNKGDERKITVSNVSGRATRSQIQSFFTKFGKVHSCHIPVEDRRQTMYATLPKNPKKSCTVTITFKSEEGALRAKLGNAEELIFYGQQMSVSSYVSSGRRRTTSTTDSGAFHIGDSCQKHSTVAGPSSHAEEGKLSRSSSAASISSSGTLCSIGTPCAPCILLDEMPPRVLQRIFCFLNPIDRICLERVNKSWLEAAAKAWTQCESLSLANEISDSGDANTLFNSTNPLRNIHLRAFLRRCGPHLQVLNLSGVVNLLDDGAIEEIAQQCHSLVELDLSGVNASPTALRSLSEQLPHLKRVSYRGMRNFDERHFWSVFKSNARSIRFVDLRGSIHLRGRCFKLFGTELEQVLLDGCRKVDDEVVEDMCTRFNSLKVLRLDGCELLSDESISLISRHLTELTKLSLGGDRFTKMTPGALVDLARLKSLRWLSFNYNPMISGKFIEAIVKGIPNLQGLSIGFAEDSLIDSKSLLKLCDLKELVELDVSGLSAVNNTFFKALCSSCHKLSKLAARSCIYLGDEGVESIAQSNLPDLENVDLSGCILVTCKSIQALVNAYKVTTNGQQITLVVGGTVCEPNQIRGAIGGPAKCLSRIYVDFSDNSAMNLNYMKDFFALSKTYLGDVEDNFEHEQEGIEDEFGLLSAHRSFIADALNTEDDSPTVDDKSVLEWAQKEAAQLGLIGSQESSK
ncbi:putative RNA-binding protein EEED8.10 [Ditylenchus destructor]|uniref:RNA-binding protein EEED8.10 n=1 Tax=Ditylenchus destructor TaxID=166010 RepID=A0AAD4RCN8_9BILA|nr:putative RNA-binding protein EEED8.10 [Ditylenchus destructor]